MDCILLERTSVTWSWLGWLNSFNPCSTEKATASTGIFGALAVCDEKKTNEFEPVNILQWLAIKELRRLGMLSVGRHAQVK